MAVKVNQRSEKHRFGLEVRVGGSWCVRLPPGHLWRDKWTTPSRPHSQCVRERVGGIQRWALAREDAREDRKEDRPV